MSFILFLLLVLILGLVGSVRIANQYERAVVFRLGKYADTKGPGLYLLIPLIEWQQTIDIRTTATSVEDEEAITRDNVPVKINAVIWRTIVDAKLSSSRSRMRAFLLSRSLRQRCAML
jgi:regulator of protease activity HflC (stomatin/prohibitin superfamily)